MRSRVVFVCMAHRTHADNRARTIESKFYLPVGMTPPFEAYWVERIWARLFNHRVEPSK